MSEQAIDQPPAPETVNPEPKPHRGRKLTEEQIREIIASTDSQRVIAKRYGVQQPFVSDVKTGRRWAHLQPAKAYQPKKLRPKVSNEDITQYDPMIKMMINDHVLKYWAGGNSCSTLDSRATIGRLGMSIEDLIQEGRQWVMEQTRYIKRCAGSRSRTKSVKAKPSSLMFMHLKRKFISLSRQFSTERHGGSVVGVDEHRRLLQAVVDRLDSTPEMSKDEAVKALADALPAMNKDLRKALTARLFREDGSVRVDSAQAVRSIAHQRLIETNSVSHVDLDDENVHVYDNMTPEDILLAKEQILLSDGYAPEFSEPVRPQQREKIYRFRIFERAKELGLPTKHGDLARYLGRSPGGLSNILHDQSNGTPEFRQRLRDVFGESLEELRRPVVI